MWVSVLRIIGCALTPPLAALTVLIADSDQYVRRNWLEEFAGFNRQLIIPHLPKGMDPVPGRRMTKKAKNEIQSWKVIDPDFLKLPKQDQISKIESLLEQERNGFSTPALVKLRKQIPLPPSYELEIRRVNRDRWLGLAIGVAFAILLFLQVIISLLGLIMGKPHKEERRDYYQERVREVSRYCAAQASAGRR